MDFIFASLKSPKLMNELFCKLVNAQKSFKNVSFVFLQASKRSKKMHVIFCLKKLRKHECSLLQPRKSLKSSKSINLIDCKLRKAQKASISFFASLKR
eukprot:UN21616